MRKRTKILVIGLLGLLLGAMVGYFADWWLGPSHGDIRSAARSLVPDGAKVISEGENTGHHLIVGKYFALVFSTVEAPTKPPWPRQFKRLPDPKAGEKPTHRLPPSLPSPSSVVVLMGL